MRECRRVDRWMRGGDGRREGMERVQAKIEINATRYVVTVMRVATAQESCEPRPQPLSMSARAQRDGRCACRCRHRNMRHAYIRC